MFINSKLTNSVRLAMAFGAAAATAFSTNAIAQEGADVVEKIEVTGSRIKRTDMETPVPVAVISREDIAQIGALNVQEVLQYTPITIASQNSSNSTFTNSSVGLNTTQLRNLDSSRTLVLVNGRRFVSGVTPNVGYAVDLNAIPTAIIERIEILKSASSAVYGTDAVAGVVNIITRQDFEGVSVNVQSGISDDSDREKASFSITSGGTWDTGNAWISIGYDDDKGLNSRDRSFSARDQAIINDANGNEVIGDIFSSFPPQGRVSIDGGHYNGDGTPFSFAQVPTSEGGLRFNRADFRQLVTPLERKYAAAGLRQEINDDFSVFTEINYNSSETNNSTIEPTPFAIHDDAYFQDRGGPFNLSLFNPLVPELLRNNILAADPTRTDFSGGQFVRRMVEFGPRSTDVQRDTIRVASGFDWAISDDWTVNAYMSWGKTQQTQENGGQVNVERFTRALDVSRAADGTLQCNDELARLQGCVPANIFGTLSAAAVDYIKVPAKVNSSVEQFIMSASIAGETPFELAGGAVSLAAGYEYRYEQGAHSPGDLAQTGASSTNRTAPTSGSFTTKDIFVETRLPVLDNLSVDLAARYTDHSIVDGNATWNFGVEYTPLEGLMFRGSAARAIRTPNIANLFAGRGETFRNVQDPCNGVTATTGGTVAQNCLSIPSVAARVASTGALTLTQVERQSTGGFVGGNPNVKEETADTWSVGAVWQITDGLDMTIDYYNIEIDNAIRTTSRTVVLNRCFAVATSAFDASCNGQARRDGNGALTGVDSFASNENILNTSGIDLELGYKFEALGGEFSTNLVYTYIDEFELTEIASGRVEIQDGEIDNPDHRATLRTSLWY